VAESCATTDRPALPRRGFGLDSLIEIGASTVVLWELSGTGDIRRFGFAVGGDR
jgi:hypothetical protein